MAIPLSAFQKAVSDALRIVHEIGIFMSLYLIQLEAIIT
jgi:hypothetical protein